MDGGHTGTEKRSTRRSTQTDTPGPAAATPTWNNTGPGWTGGGPDTPATDEAGGPLGGGCNDNIQGITGVKERHRG